MTFLERKIYIDIYVGIVSAADATGSVDQSEAGLAGAAECAVEVGTDVGTLVQSQSTLVQICECSD